MDQGSPTLALCAGSLGDCILTLPALQALSSRFSVTVAGTTPYLGLGADLLGVGQVVALEPLLQKLYAGQKEAVAPFEHLFVFFKEPDASLLSSLDGKTTHAASLSFVEFLKRGRWAGDYWLEIVRTLFNDSSLDRKPRLHLTPELEKMGAQKMDSLMLNHPLVIHPGSGSRSKNAPLSFFVKAAERTVKETSRQVLVLWGEAEQDWLQEIKEAFGSVPGTKTMDGILPLKELVSVLSQAGGYLGNDSGVTHLASACGTRTFAVFNQTDSRIWGPQEAIILETLKVFYA